MYKKRRYSRKFKRSRKYNFRRSTRRFKRTLIKVMEKKYSDLSYAASNLQNSGQLIAVSQVPASIGYSGRTGNKIFQRYVKMNLSFQNGSVSYTFIRVSVIRGRSVAIGLSNCPLASENQPWDVDLFHVYYDKVFSLGNAQYDGKDKLNLNRTIKIMKDAQFDSNTAASQTTNPIFVFLWSNDSITPSPTWAGNLRFTFSDLL